MTVKELINFLKSFPKDLQVVDSEYYFIISASPSVKNDINGNNATVLRLERR